MVINSSADNQLSLRTGISATIIPNVMDFKTPPPPPDDYARDVRQALGLEADERFILQPTRVVERKGIEHAIERAYHDHPDYRGVDVPAMIRFVFIISCSPHLIGFRSHSAACGAALRPRAGLALVVTALGKRRPSQRK